MERKSMLSEEEIKTRIKELEHIGSPSAIVKAAELKLVLGIDSDESDNESLVDILLGNLKKDKEPSWDKLPAWVRDHNLYTFTKQKEVLKKKYKVDKEGNVLDENDYILVSKDRPWVEKYEALTGIHNEKEKVWKSRKKTTWEKLLGKEASKKMRKAIAKLKDGDSAYTETLYTMIPDAVAELENAELIASITKDGKHRPLLDIDIPAVIIPSSTKDHGHLYIDKELTWKDYQKLLNVLADLGIIEHGYRGASLSRGYTALRLPWVKKEETKLDKII